MTASGYGIERFTGNKKGFGEIRSLSFILFDYIRINDIRAENDRSRNKDQKQFRLA